MLGKLLKHEFRATARTMWPFYAALLITSLGANVAVRVMESKKYSDSVLLRIFSTLVIILFVVALAAVGIMTLVMMVQRFQKNLLTSEGYLMFTLPVSEHSLILSKTITAAVWFLATGAAQVLAMLIMSFRVSYVNKAWEDIRQLFSQITSYYAVNGAAFILEALAVAFLGCAVTCLMFYAAMALGYGFPTHKGLLSVVFFFVFLVALQILGTMGLFASFDGGLLGRGYVGTNTAVDVIRSVHLAMGVAAAAELVLGGIFYAVTALNLKHRLNLE